MEVTDEPKEVKINKKSAVNKLWQAYTKDTSSALKFNFKHASSSDCNYLCAQQSLTSTNYKNQLPYPLSQNSECNVKDTVFEIVNKKHAFQINVDDICMSFKRSQKGLKVKKQFKCYKDLQCVLETDPDPFFSSNYNWYYTGGNLQFQCVGDLNLLFHVLNGKLAVAKVKQKASHWKVYKKQTISPEFESTVYQLDSFHKNNVSLVSAQEKHKITLFNVSLQEDNTSITSNEVVSKTNKIPFVGHSINKNAGNEYTSIDTNQELTIWDIETGRQKHCHKIPINYDDIDGDYFAQLSYRNDNTLAYISRTELYLFDTRTNCESNYFLKYTDLISPVDRFTNICPNKQYDSNFFISSFRDILQMDIRYLNAVNKWGHTFDSAPLLSDLRAIDGQNVYCVSSANANEKLLIDNSNLPEYLPSCVQSFETCILSNPYLNQQEEILNRLNFKTTGLQLHHKNGHTVLFTVNAAGDLFSQKIKCQESEESNQEKINSKFQKWNRLMEDWYRDEEHFKEVTVVDKVVLHDLDMNYNEANILPDLKKELRINDIVYDLKRTKKGINSKITEVWFGVEHNLDDIEEIEPQTNVANWLNQTSLITPENNMCD